MAITEIKLQAFLAALRETCNITKAAEAAGLSSSTIYRHKKENPIFAERFEEALQEGIDLLEFEAHRRAFKGVDKPVFYRDQQIATVTEYSDGLAMFLLKAHRPNRYRERSEVNMNGQHQITVVTGVPNIDDGSDLL